MQAAEREWFIHIPEGRRNSQSPDDLPAVSVAVVFLPRENAADLRIQLDSWDAYEQPMAWLALNSIVQTLQIVNPQVPTMFRNG